jgi:tubulin beta
VYKSKDPLQLDRIGTYFEEIEPRAGVPARYVPRSIQIDLEGGVINRVSFSLCVGVRLTAS